MKKILLITLLFIITNLFSENIYQQEYQQLLQNNNLDELFTHLKKWDDNTEDDVELLIAYFNYYLRLGSSSQTTLGSLGEGGYGLYEKQYFDKKPTEVALIYLDRALFIAPNRLDVHFGKCSVLAQTYQYKKLKDSILCFLNFSEEINNDWLWSNNVSFKKQGWNVEDAIISATSDYLNYMFEYYEDSKPHIKEIVECYLEIYPENVIGLNIAARYYDLNGDLNIKISLLEKAYKINPSDYIIIGNLAYTFETIESFDKAKYYYSLMLDIDNKTSQEYGKSGLNRINNK